MKVSKGRSCDATDFVITCDNFRREKNSFICFCVAFVNERVTCRFSSLD